MSIGSRQSLGSFSILLSAFIVVTSLLDLFVNRLLFRAGPEVLANLYVPGLAQIAKIGTISFTFEQLALYLVLGAGALLLFRGRSSLSRNLGFLMFPQLACAALLYFPLSTMLSWDISMLLLLITGVEIFGLVFLNVRANPGLIRWELVGTRLFQASIAISFLLLFYNRFSVLLVGLNLGSLPAQLQVYVAATYMVVVASVASLIYAVTVRSSEYTMRIRSFVKAALVPTLIVIPVLVGLIESFDMTQIMSMVIAMSTDIILDFQMVRVMTAACWFLMTAVVVLWFKWRGSHNWFFFQKGVGLIFLLSTTFLFNYPNYVLLGTAGVFLMFYPLRAPNRQPEIVSHLAVRNASTIGRIADAA